MTADVRAGPNGDRVVKRIHDAAISIKDWASEQSTTKANREGDSDGEGKLRQVILNGDDTQRIGLG